MVRHVRILGHRGTSARCCENSIAAFRQSVDDGAAGVELDVRQGANGALVVCHDPVLADGRPVHLTGEADLPPEVPTLGQVLDAGPWYLNIEIKNDPEDPGHEPTGALARAVVAEVIGRDARHRVLISSFDLATLDQVRAADPEMAIGWLVSGSPLSAGGAEGDRAEGDRAEGDLAAGDLVGLAVAHGCVALHPAASLVDADLVDRAHRAGLALNVWTVDDPERIRQLADLGVDAIIANDPAVALAALS